MPVYGYIGIGYLVIINLVTLIVYIKEAEEPSTRISALVLFLLPIIGGSFGAILANYFRDTSYRELRSGVAKVLAYLPPVMFIIQFVLIVYMIGVGNCFSFLWNFAYTKAGVIGCILLVLNFLSFVLIVIRRSAYYIAPSGNSLIADYILIPVLVLGGATGALLAKIIFNFKENDPCNCTKEVQNFMYGAGVYIFCVIHIGLFIYFFCIR
ncbi:MAG: DUF1294 domain-containing protein [Mobilitalea sp.]